MAFLYFDPGLGAMIAQIIIAAIVGVSVFTKNLWFKIKLFFGMVKSQETDDFLDDIDEKEMKSKNNDDVD